MIRSATTSADAAADGPADEAVRSATAVYELLTSFVRHTPRDMSLTSLSTLSTLERRGPRRITELAASEGVTQPSVTSLVRSMERLGLVERHSDPADKRVVMVAITTEGSAYIRARREIGALAFARALDKLSPEDAAALAAAVPLIERIRELVDAPPDAE